MPADCQTISEPQSHSGSRSVVAPPNDCMQSVADRIPALGSGNQLSTLPHANGNPVPRYNEGNEYDGCIVRQLVVAFPPWMISLTFHIIGILVLAVFAFQQSEGQNTIELSAVTEPSQPTDILSFEINTNEQKLQAETAQLESSSSSSAFKNHLQTKLKSQNTQDWTTGELLAAYEFDNIRLPDGKSKKSGDGSVKTGNGEKGNGNDGATFYGIKAKGETFVYVLDNSGSMTGIRWLQACSEVIRSINSLGDKQKFLVVLYNTHTSVMLGQRGNKIACLQATKSNREKVIRWLAKQAPQLDTLPLHSLKIALRVKPDAVFLLSDGEFRDGTLEFLRKANFDQQKQSDLVRNRGFYVRATHCDIHTIAFKSYVGAPLLRRIAHENNGTFRYVE